MSRGLVSRRAAGTGQSMVDQAGHAHRRQIFAKSAKPPCAVSDSSVAASLNGKTVCNVAIAPTG